MFDTGKPSKRLADAITITSVKGFRESIKKLKGKKGYLTVKEFRALNLAKQRARAQLKRKDLTPAVRKRFATISKINIPKAK